jgi:hypothetical protein
LSAWISENVIITCSYFLRVQQIQLAIKTPCLITNVQEYLGSCGIILSHICALHSAYSIIVLSYYVYVNTFEISLFYLLHYQNWFELVRKWFMPIPEPVQLLNRTGTWYYSKTLHELMICSYGSKSCFSLTFYFSSFLHEDF